MALRTEQFVVLTEELTIDPLVRGYAGMSDPEAANDLNQARYVGPSIVVELQSYCFGNTHNPLGAGDTTQGVAQLWRLFECVRDEMPITVNPLTQKQIEAGWALSKILNRPADDTWDPDNSITKAALDQLILAEAMTEQHKTDIVALANNKKSRATVLGLPPVHHLDVAEAR